MVRLTQPGVALVSPQIFVDNFVHADLHPGNILVQGADGLAQGPEARLQQVDVCEALAVAVSPARCPLRLVLLDAGIVAELQAADLRNFRAVFMAVAMGQVRPAGPSGGWGRVFFFNHGAPQGLSFLLMPAFAKGAPERGRREEEEKPRR